MSAPTVRDERLTIAGTNGANGQAAAAPVATEARS